MPQTSRRKFRLETPSLAGRDRLRFWRAVDGGRNRSHGRLFCLKLLSTTSIGSRAAGFQLKIGFYYARTDASTKFHFLRFKMGLLGPFYRFSQEDFVQTNFSRYLGRWFEASRSKVVPEAFTHPVDVLKTLRRQNLSFQSLNKFFGKKGHFLLNSKPFFLIKFLLFFDFSDFLTFSNLEPIRFYAGARKLQRPMRVGTTWKKAC